MKIHRYETLASTNNEAQRLSASLADGDVIVCREQTAGRGQRGNSWESEPGKNLTFTLFLRPASLSASDSFLLSMAVSVGIVEAINKIIAPEEVKIKWPNDIYHGDSKLAGILIENAFSGGQVGHSIVGIGLNVNQEKFVSDAPNPISLLHITGRLYDLECVLADVAKTIVAKSHKIDSAIVERYHKSLWRSDGEYQWHEPDGSAFRASIQEVKPTGHLVLRTAEGPRSYAFKEVFPIL